MSANLAGERFSRYEEPVGLLMRLERDSLGEVQIADEEYIGVGTERLATMVGVNGTDMPVELPLNIVRVRKAQAVAYGRNGIWEYGVSMAVQSATDRIITGAFPLAAHLRIRPLHGGGARSLIGNVDEIIANVALEKMGKDKGEYHLIAPLFQLDRGLATLETYLTALHITLLEEIDQLIDGIDQLVCVFCEKGKVYESRETVLQLHFQQVAIAGVGSELSLCVERLQRSRQQFEWFRSRLLPCWRGPSEVLLALRESSGIELAVCQNANDFPRNADLYLGLSALIKTTGMGLLQFCNSTRLALVLSKEMDVPRIRANQPFNPTGRETIVPDTVSQAIFLIIGGDASITAAINSSACGAMAYLPVFSAQLIWCGQWLRLSLKLLSENFATGLTVDSEVGGDLVDGSPLQAEKLISVLGYDRAVQVARIAALTEKPVRTVVKKMKLLDEEQIQKLFSSRDEDEIKNNDS